MLNNFMIFFTAVSTFMFDRFSVLLNTLMMIFLNIAELNYEEDTL